MMTDDEILKVVQAHKEGKKIEYRPRGTLDWIPVECDGGPCWSFNTDNYRIAPTPTLRPWKPEEVPVAGALYRESKNKDRWSTVKESYVSLDTRYIVLSFHSGAFHTAELLRDGLEHSLDNGKTWLPCGVMEEP